MAVIVMVLVFVVVVMGVRRYRMAVRMWALGVAHGVFAFIIGQRCGGVHYEIHTIFDLRSQLRMDSSTRGEWPCDRCASDNGIILRFLSLPDRTSLGTLDLFTGGNQCSAYSSSRVKIVCNGASADFYNAFRVLYSPAILGVPEFEVDTLISALRIASTYNYADLRNFAIEELEKCSLPSIDQIRLSDEFFLPNWEQPAFVDLCYRAEPITISEAQSLGIERFTEISRIREAQQRQRFMELFDQVAQPHPLLAQMQGPDKATALRRDAEFSCRYTALPQCNCKIQKDESGARFMALCQLHKIAPVILKESHTLFEQRNEFLNRLASLNKAITTEKLEVVDGMKIASVERELSKAPWIRRAGGKSNAAL
ncbi:unnamed protein product [Rhizoctonia solani]|uniref:BTB domain-containing protein n=1 Tax=Rhizoctonia solani TaxID=456999 RepID=A0A8H3E6F8_9AGAM|nr:unnamed protein product [Rhizoctonia solani]